jgi:hypothetical protein
MKNAIIALFALPALLLSCGKNGDEHKNRGASTSLENAAELENEHEKLDAAIALLVLSVSDTEPLYTRFVKLNAVASKVQIPLILPL